MVTGNESEKMGKVAQTLALLEGMQRLRLVPADVKVTDEGVTLTGVARWEDPVDHLRDGAR
ncbi:MAG TPA: hypothetical protein VIV60_17715 [Polyangiaceae bacterium]